MGLLDAFLYLLGPWPLFLCVLGTALGIIVGAIPGLSGAMLIALTLPLTFKMAPEQAMALIVCMYTGSITGGLVSAVLLRIPGTPSNVITVFDCYAMAQKGQAGRALGLGVGASLFGAIFAWFALLLLTKPLADVAVRFTPFYFFALVLTALVLISSVSGKSMAKGPLAGTIGVLLSFPGDGLQHRAHPLYDGFVATDLGIRHSASAGGRVWCRHCDGRTRQTHQ